MGEFVISTLGKQEVEEVPRRRNRKRVREREGERTRARVRGRLREEDGDRKEKTGGNAGSQSGGKNGN